jgi:iron complex outermembrane receptor protein
MKRVFVLLGCAILLSPSLWGQKNDSLRIVNLNDVVISAYRTKRTTPMAVSQIGRKEIVQNNLGRDLPYILMNTPSVVVTSDNGLGIGTTYFRVRGADNSRVNFTYDGVPMNDSEDQSVFWANMNSFAASLDNIQIQRGVGTSTMVLELSARPF